MNRRNAGLLVLIVAIALIALWWIQPKLQSAPAELTLKVKLNYTGAGTVDEKHKVFVLVFDANPFTAERLDEWSAKPEAKSDKPAAGQAMKTAYILARQGAPAKDKTLTFTGLPVNPVYVVAFYDKAGTYEGHSEPGSGSSTGLYGTKPGQPDAVKLEKDKAVEIVVAFDDTTKIP
jgi:hypothetical protein